MSRTAKLVAVAAASAAAVVVTAAPALAWTGGAVSASLTSPLTVSLGGASCTGSTLTGSVTAAGVLSIPTATISGCTAAGSSIPVTPQNLPWGGKLTDGGGVASLTGFRVSATWLGVTCVYGGNINGTNTAKSGSPASTTATFTNASVSKVSGSFLCPGTAQVSAAYKFTGAGL
ncbi:hypothetical protein [Actinocorallia aurantiaca]|uniref:Secreted protein n=1 Tax=Actinocorallia aurantiaca TaxID=46204 RepID=A0ABP6H8N3_9ACTN